MLRYLPLMLALPGLATADNIAACEVAVVDVVEGEGGARGEVVAFRDATAFIAAAVDAAEDPEAETLVELDGFEVRALLCERASVVPSESDRVLLATGVPLSLSVDFDSLDAATVTIAQDGEGGLRLLKGDGLSAADMEGLQAFLLPAAETDE